MDLKIYSFRKKNLEVNSIARKDYRPRNTRKGTKRGMPVRYNDLCDKNRFQRQRTQNIISFIFLCPPSPHRHMLSKIQSVKLEISLPRFDTINIYFDFSCAFKSFLQISSDLELSAQNRHTFLRKWWYYGNGDHDYSGFKGLAGWTGLGGITKLKEHRSLPQDYNQSILSGETYYFPKKRLALLALDSRAFFMPRKRPRWTRLKKGHQN